MALPDNEVFAFANGEDNPPTHKWCPKCKYVLKVEEFYTDETQKYNISCECEDCDPQHEKECEKCGLTKPLEEFPPDERKRGGCRDECRDCRDEYLKEYTQTERAKIMARERNRKYRAKKKGVEYVPVEVIPPAIPKEKPKTKRKRKKVVEYRKCPKCGLIKPLKDFYKNSKARCIECLKDWRQQPKIKAKAKERNAEYRADPANKQKHVEYMKEYQQTEKYKTKRKEDYDAKKDDPEFKKQRSIKAKKIRSRPGYREKNIEYQKKYRAKPGVKERDRERRKEYSQKPEVKERKKEKYREKMQDPWCRSVILLRGTISTAFKRGGNVKDGRTLEILGVEDWETAINHVGIWWEGSEVDHIIPITAAEEGNYEELEVLNKIWNLRRITKEHNITKKDKLPERHLLHPNLPPLALEIYERELAKGREVFCERTYWENKVPLIFTED